jgi:hypothetical protein
MKSKPKKLKASPTKVASGKNRAKLQVTTETERKAPARIGDIDSGTKVAVDL